MGKKIHGGGGSQGSGHRDRLGPEAAPTAGDASAQLFQGAGIAQTGWSWQGPLPSMLSNLLSPAAVRLFSFFLALKGVEESRFTNYGDRGPGSVIALVFREECVVRSGGASGVKGAPD